MRSPILLRFRGTAAISAAAVLLLSGLCLAADFTADMVTEFGKTTIPGKLYVSGANWRQEASINGKQQIIIARGKSVYIMDPASKQYATKESSDNPWSASSMTRVLSGGMNKKSGGKQRVNGIVCDKYVYTSRDGKPGTITQYAAKELDLSVRVEMKSEKGTLSIDFKNIKKGPSPASLFQLPKGYKKVSASPAQPKKGK